MSRDYLKNYWISIYPVRDRIDKLTRSENYMLYSDFLNKAYHITIEFKEASFSNYTNLDRAIRKIPSYDQFKYYIYNHKEATLYFYTLDEIKDILLSRCSL